MVGGSAGATTTRVPLTSTTTTTTLPDKLTIVPVDRPPLQFVVIDPEQPVGEGTEQCLGISVYTSQAAAENGDLAAYEGWDCGPGDRGAKPITLRMAVPEGGDPNLGANVGPCAVTVENVVPVVSGSDVGETTFTVTDLPTGSYWVELTAWSGIGDGCDVENAPYERENITSTSELITIP